MAFWVEKDAVLCSILAPQTSPDDVVAVPPRQFGDFLVTEWTEAALLSPEGEQFPFPFKVVCHFHIETFFKVRLPFRVIGISFTLDFDMSFDGDVFCLEQANGLECPILSKDFSMKDPVLPFNGREVFLLNPFESFLWVSPFCPLPQRAEDGVVHFREGFFTHHMPVVIRPSPNFGVQLGDEISSRGLFVCLHHLSDILQKGLNVLSGGRNEQFSLVFSQVLPKKVKAILNVGDEGFL